MHVRKNSSRDILDPYLAIGINKELDQESRNQAKILHDSESCRQKLIVAGPSGESEARDHVRIMMCA